MNKIKVSFIVPVYNAEKYLKECLDSLLEQTLEEIEIICIDDGSTDTSMDILREYQNKDGRVIVLSNSQNMGQPTSRNKGMERARGKYIQFVDADDFIEQNAAEELYEIAEKKNADMCYMGMQIVAEDGLSSEGVPGAIHGSYPDVYDGKKLMKRLIEEKEFFFYTWSVFYRTVFLKENRLVYRELVCGQGGNFIPRCLYYAKRVIVCNYPYYHYRVHNASITHSLKARKELLFGKIMRYIDMLQYLAKDEDSAELAVFLDETYKKLQGGIQGLTLDEKQELEKRMPSQFAAQVFHLLCKKERNYDIHLPQDAIERIKGKKQVIIYGAGDASKDILEIVQENEIEIVGFAVTKIKDGRRNLYGHHIYEIAKLKKYKETAIVLVAANKRFNKEIVRTLEELEFQDYILLGIEI